MTIDTAEDLPTITEEPTETFTQYLVVHNNETSLCGVVDMLDEWVNDAGTIQAVYLVTPDGRVTSVGIDDVTGGGKDDKGIEYEITVGDDNQLIEYVCFVDEDSNELVDRHVYVNGYKTELAR